MPYTRDWPLMLAELTTEQVASVLESDLTSVALLPVGSTEPHGPHLPLATDMILSAETARRAALALRERGLAAFVAPALPYGVTDYAEGFAGAISLAAPMVTELVAALCRAYLRDGWRHVSLVNNHLEPEHVAALHAAVLEVNEAGGGADEGVVPVSLPNVLSRRWGATLTEEFKRGACHAGRYEGSLVLAATPQLVDTDTMATLPDNPTSISEAMKDGKKTFREMGGDRAYFGAPASATAAEGEESYGKLVTMVVTEVLEALGQP